MIKKWFKKKFKQWSVEAWNSEKIEVEQSNISMDSPIRSSDSIHGGILDSGPTLQFTVYNAIGGKVVEFRTYDNHKDRRHHQVYIIGKDEDFGEKIGKIATLESLKQ
jgi:hypothetical protein